MTRSKLTELDKQAITQGFRRGESVQALADRFDVSSSTVRRILKSSIAEGDEGMSTPSQDSLAKVGPRISQLEIPAAELPVVSQPAPLETEPPAAPIITAVHQAPQLDVNVPAGEQPLPGRRLRRRSSIPAATAIGQTLASKDTGAAAESGRLEPDIPLVEAPASPAIPKPILNRQPAPELKAPELKELEDELNHLDEDLDDDLDDLDEDLEDDEFDTEDELDLFDSATMPSIDLVNILPLSAAAFPRPCYLVIDRSAELITRPLKDFADLGQIPSGEVQEITLPVFDNHRMARRFSNRTQRIIKVPDGTLLQKVGSHLYARGITRVLLNGKVYAMDHN